LGDPFVLDDILVGAFPCARRVVTINALAAESFVRSTQALPEVAVASVGVDFRGPADASPVPSYGACTEIASMPPNSHLDVVALASILGRCKKSIQRAVRRGELPAPFTFMGRHVWLAGKIVDHLQKRQDDALRQAERRARKIEDQKRGS
jgi:hypothetical protein